MELPGWIVQVLIGGGSAVVVTLGLFRFLGQSWIKHRLDKELERAKSEITLHAAKRLKLHDKGFEVFPEIWMRLIDVRSSLVYALDPIKKWSQYKKEFSEKEIDGLAKIDNFTEYEWNEKVKHIDTYAWYILTIHNRRIDESREKYNEFHDYLQKNRIFLNPEIGAEFDKIAHLMDEVWKIFATNSLGKEENPVESLNYADKILNNDIEPLMKKIENIIQGELFPEKEKKQS